MTNEELPDPQDPNLQDSESFDPDSEAATRKISLSSESSGQPASGSEEPGAGSEAELKATESVEGLTEEEIASAPTQDVPGMPEARETEEVYVILPDGADVDVPLVETEALGQGTAEEAAAAESPGPTGLVTEQISEPAEPAEARTTDFVPTENLDEIASELDDEVLQSEEEELLSGVVPEAALAEEGGLEPQGGPEASAAKPRKRGRARALVAVAALVVAGVAVYFAWPYLPEAVTENLPFSVAKAPVLPPPEPPPTLPATGEKAPASGVEAPKPQAPESDAVQVARAAFREKLVMSLELGFVGEVEHD